MSDQQPEESIVFDRAVEYYDATRGLPEGVDRKIGAWMAETAGIQPDAQVLEIGVGTGRIALPLAGHVGRYYGVDLSMGMMGKLRQKQPNYDGHVHIAQADIQQLPVKSSSMDNVVAVHILHLVPSPEQAAEEVKRVLKSGGKVLQCRGRWYVEQFEPLWEAWREGTGTESNVPTRYDRARSIFSEQGWVLEGEYNYDYLHRRSADELMQVFRGRLMSSMWLMSDDQWQSGVDATEAALKAHYADPHQAHEVTGRFIMRVFTPPV